MLVARDLHFAEGFKKAPLIYSAIFKSATFAIVLGCFKILEETLPFTAKSRRPKVCY